MTRNEFLEKLRETPREWKFDAWGRIRCSSNNYCPIEEVVGRGGVVLGAAELGLSDDDLFAIMITADNSHTCHEWDGNLRLQLRNACSLP